MILRVSFHVQYSSMWKWDFAKENHFLPQFFLKVDYYKRNHFVCSLLPEARTPSTPTLQNVGQEGNNRSPEKQLAESINIIRDCKQPLVVLPCVLPYGYIVIKNMSFFFFFFF